tara:strand:- start:18 stop:842 length:825 start_codon:yes stop_codon:yes gene_type:complete
MKLTIEQLQEHMQYLREHIKMFNTTKRADALTTMYDHFEERMMLAPASSMDYFHNCFPGGYIDHVKNITEAGKKLFKLYKEFGFKLSYDLDSVIFCTMHHDLGKLGSLTEDYYRPNPSEWHRINQGKMYETNPNLHSMTVTDRAVYTLSQFGVTYTEAEYLGLRLADGMYEEGNKYYLMGFGESKKLKTNLPQLVHQADMIATRYEMENYMFSEDANIPYADILGIKLDDVEPRVVDVASGKAIVPSKPVKKSKPKVDKDYKNKLFDELFGDKK